MPFIFHNFFCSKINATFLGEVISVTSKAFNSPISSKTPTVNSLPGRNSSIMTGGFTSSKIRSKVFASSSSFST